MTDIVDRLDGLRSGNGDLTDEAMLDAMEAIIRIRRQRDELIEALEAMLEGHKVQHTSPWVLEKASNAARTAIRKAKGEQ